MKKVRIVHVVFIVFGALFASLLGYLFIGFPSVDPSTQYGVTWSSVYADELGMDSMAGLTATLDDLGVRRFRIPAYWSEVEPQKGVFHFERLQATFDAIAARGGKAIVTVGATAPRWPECWMPMWAEQLPVEERRTAQLAYVREVHARFKDHPALVMWQVENEPSLILFGKCKDQPKAFLEKEMRLVRDLESTRATSTRLPVITTNSGEFSTWLDFPGLTDARGISVYRSVLVSWWGVWRYDFLTTTYYRRKANLVEWLTGPIFVSEFQMEPWELAPLPQVPLDQQFKMFNVDEMKRNFQFAQELHMPQVYFWGVEWWYWMKTKQNHPEFWETAKGFFGGK